MIRGTVHRNLWSLTVLCLLRERPLHPYEMQRLIRERHKDDFLDLKRGSLYHAIERLLRSGMIEVLETTREGRRPERTIYQLTALGEREVLDWLRELLARPAHEPSQFLAAVSFLGHLTPDDARVQFQIRARELECSMVALDSVRRALVERIGRIPLLELEYALAMRKAEMEWIRATVGEIEAGQLRWNQAQLCARSELGEGSQSAANPVAPQGDAES